MQLLIAGLLALGTAVSGRIDTVTFSRETREVTIERRSLIRRVVDPVPLGQIREVVAVAGGRRTLEKEGTVVHGHRATLELSGRGGRRPLSRFFGERAETEELVATIRAWLATARR